MRTLLLAERVQRIERRVELLLEARQLCRRLAALHPGPGPMAGPVMLVLIIVVLLLAARVQLLDGRGGDGLVHEPRSRVGSSSGGGIGRVLLLIVLSTALSNGIHVGARVASRIRPV